MTFSSNATGAHLSITAAELFHLRQVARGITPPTTVIRHGTILALHTGELLRRDIVISGRHIAAVTPWNYFLRSRYSEDANIEEIEARGKFVSPSFIDTHIHVEYTKLVPGELARLSVPKGTTTILADANCIANVLGGKGMDFMGTTSTPLRILRQVSHKVPAGSPEVELGGASLSVAEISDRVSRCEAATLGESNPFSLDMASAEKQAAALHAGKRITGHTALLENEPLWAYCAGGIGDDHNAHQPQDVLERLRLGMMLTVMSGSMNSNLPAVFSNTSIYKDALRHISFCADDKLCEDLAETGHIDMHVREAIKLGVSIPDAYRMATLNAAQHYRLDHLIGSIGPGKLADLLILPALEDVRPDTVLVDGNVVAQDGKPVFKNEDTVPEFTLPTVTLHPSHLEPASYALRPRNSEAKMAWVQAVEMYDGYFKRAFHAALQVDSNSGTILCSTELDVLKVVVVDRHHATTHRGIGFVRGFGLKRGAVATTTNCENQNLVIVGTSDLTIAGAARAINDLGGGSGGMIAVGDDGEVLGSLRLDVAGCMSSKPWEQVRDVSLLLDKVVREELGGTMHSPFMIASFVGLIGVPDLGLTEMGLVTGGGEALMDPVLEVECVAGEIQAVVDREEPVRVCCRCPSHGYPVHRLMDPPN